MTAPRSFEEPLDFSLRLYWLRGTGEGLVRAVIMMPARSWQSMDLTVHVSQLPTIGPAIAAAIHSGVLAEEARRGAWR